MQSPIGLFSHGFLTLMIAALVGCGGGGGGGGSGTTTRPTNVPPYGLVFEAGPLVRTPDAPGTFVAKGASIAYRVCDVNGDGRADIVLGVANLPGIGIEAPASMRVLLNQGNGTFREDDASISVGDLPKRVHPRHIHCGDLNGDGRQDVFVAAHGWDAPPYPMETNVLLLSAAGRWVDQSLTLPQAPGFTHSAALADIDADGDLDIYVGGIAGGPAPYFLINDGRGNFTPSYTRLPPQITTFASQHLAAILVDIDNDGYSDLVLGTYGQYPSRVLMNDRRGNFVISSKALPVPPPSPRGGTEVFAMWLESIDIDGDGWRDLVISYTNPTVAGIGNSGAVLQLLRNDQLGGFIDETESRFSGSQTNNEEGWIDVIRVADINGDGAPDLVVSNYVGRTTANTPFMWLNDGNGKYRPITRLMLNLQPNPSQSLILDADGDGRLDIVQAGVDQTSGWPTYQIFLNKTPR